MFRSMLAMVLLLSSTAVSADGLYRWVDKDGKVHYGDAPPMTPGQQSEKRKLAAPVADARPPSYETQLAAKNFPVSLYTAPKCGQLCDQARSLLSARGIPFSEISVNDPKRQEELVRLVGAAELPALMVGKQVHKGFEAGLYNTALDGAGYGKSPAPGQSKAPAPAATPAVTPASDPKVANEPAQKSKGRYAD
ncbi:MAG: DUF4124 domain-containing protein [Burkholderiales bacterium]